MRKLLALFVALTLFILLCGCKDGQENTQDTASQIEIILPTDDTVNGYRQDSSTLTSDSNSSNDDTQTDGYYVNTKTKKFHKLSCTYAQKGSENGFWSEISRDGLINEGYSPCGKCKP